MVLLVMFVRWFTLARVHVWADVFGYASVCCVVYKQSVVCAILSRGFTPCVILVYQEGLCVSVCMHGCSAVTRRQCRPY